MAYYLKELEEKERANINGIALSKNKIFAKQKHGAFESILENEDNIVYFQWLDNSVIMIACTIHETTFARAILPVFRVEKKKVSVLGPNIISLQVKLI